MNDNGYFEALEELEELEDLDFFEEDDDDDEAFEYLLEDLDFLEDDDDDDEAAERRRRRRRRRRQQRQSPRAASRRSFYRPRLSKNYVTQPQLQASLGRVRKDVTRNANAIKRVSAQLSSHSRQASRANRRQDKAISGLKKDLKKAQQMSLLMMLLQKPPELTEVTLNTTKDITVATNTTIPKGTEATLSVKNPQYATTDNMLPLVLLMGMGGDDKGDSSNMLLLALALSNNL